MLSFVYLYKIKKIYVCVTIQVVCIQKNTYIDRFLPLPFRFFLYSVFLFFRKKKEIRKRDGYIQIKKKQTKIIVSLIYPKYKITISNTISLFEKKVTIYLSISSIEVEVDEIQIEMVEDLVLFVFVVIRKELFERVGMNYSMSRIE